MCPQHKTPILHRWLASYALSEALVEDALKPKLGEALLHVQDGGDLEEPVRGPDSRFQGRVTAAD
jgi:hypothetical protein